MLRVIPLSLSDTFNAAVNPGRAAPCSGSARHTRRRDVPGNSLAGETGLRYLGTAVNQDKTIAKRFKADTGIEIQYIPVTTDEVTKRAVTAPNSFDLIDTEYFCAARR